MRGKGMWERIKEALFPNNYTCMICKTELSVDGKYILCDKCIDNIKFIDKGCEKCGALVIADSKICTDCKREKRVVDRNYSAIVYEGDIKELILSFKYGSRRYLKATLGRMLYDKYLDIIKEYNPDVIVPVPLYKDRLKLRGYNQTFELIKQFDSDFDKVDAINLIRIKDTPHQTSLKRSDRKRNVKGAFDIVDPLAFKNKKILVVDDVYTTGATIDECATMLYLSGATVVRSLTLAISHKDNAIDEEN